MYMLGILVFLIGAWLRPWTAYAILVTTASALLVYLTPNMPWAVTVPRSAMAVIGAIICGLCYLLPVTSAWLLAAGALIGAFFLSGYLCLAASALLSGFYFAPQTLLILLAVLAWVLFLLALPVVCLFLTEFATLTYFFPALGPFL
eukprot:scaffold245856_cov31-Tisochrysis_lutea.AAC.2